MHRSGKIKWNSRQWIGSSSNNMLGCRYIYLGLFDNEVEAARFLSLDSAHWCTIKKFFLFSPSTEVPTRISSLCFPSSFSCPGKIRAYDKAAIKCNGREAVTNFEPSTYDAELLNEVAAEGNNMMRILIEFIFHVCICDLAKILRWRLADELEFDYDDWQAQMSTSTWAYLNQLHKVPKGIRAALACNSTMDHMKALN